MPLHGSVENVVEHPKTISNYCFLFARSQVHNNSRLNIHTNPIPESCVFFFLFGPPHLIRSYTLYVYRPPRHSRITTGSSCFRRFLATFWKRVVRSSVITLRVYNFHVGESDLLWSAEKVPWADPLVYFYFCAIDIK